MPRFQVELPHRLGQEKALARLKDFMNRLADDYGDEVSSFDGSWQDNVLSFTMTTYGLKISGKLTVTEDRAVLDGELPFRAIAFRGKIAESFRRGLARALEEER